MTVWRKEHVVSFVCFVMVVCYSNGADANYESAMAAVIREYVSSETLKLEMLTEMALLLDQRAAEKSDEQRNPIDIFRDTMYIWEEWEEVLQYFNRTATEYVLSTNSNAKLPSRNGMISTLKALFRIQDVYNLDTNDIVSGSVRQFGKYSPINADEAFMIGRLAHEMNDHYHVVSWLLAALDLSKKEEHSFQEKDILPLLIVSLNEQENKQRAVSITRSLVDRLGKNESLESIYQRFPVIRYLASFPDSGNRSTSFPPLRNDRPDTYDTIEQPNYEKLCRMETSISSSSPALKCYYKTDSFYLRLAPAKVERVSVKPLVLIYRGIITDNESDILMETAEPKLHISRLNTGDPDGSISTTYRDSNTAWISVNDCNVIGTLRNRASAYTGLSMQTAESLQVLRYDFGGHYRPHYDHSVSDIGRDSAVSSYSQQTGDRIATLMFYLSTPTYGGYTAFPYANIAVPPVKGDAVFWYNLKRNGNGDNTSLHAGCPVFSGLKWVANQWIKERGQEFLRPCGLSESE